MKGTRVGSIAAFAALVGIVLAAAFGTTASASAATTLCEVNTSPCPAGKTYPSGSVFEVRGNTWIGTYTCEFYSEFKTTAASGTPLLAKIPFFEIYNCSSSLSATALHFNWSFLISAVGSGNGTGEIYVGGTTTPVEFEMTAGSTHCVYELPHLEPNIEGDGWIFTSMTAYRVSGSGCASTLTFAFEGKPSPTFYVTS